MILHRFMSNKEYLNLLMGETLTNTWCPNSFDTTVMSTPC